MLLLSIDLWNAGTGAAVAIDSMIPYSTTIITGIQALKDVQPTTLLD